MKDILGLIHEFITTNSSMSRNALADIAEELGEPAIAENIRNVRMWEIVVYNEMENSRRYLSQMRLARRESLQTIAAPMAKLAVQEGELSWPIYAECFPYYVNESTGEIVKNTHPQFYPVRFTFDSGKGDRREESETETGWA